MAVDTTVQNLIINKMTKAQYDLLQEKSDTELYLIPDVVDNTPTSGSQNYVTSDGIYNAIVNKAEKSEMKFTNGTGANVDKVTILLKSGTTSTVLRTHQDITGKENVMSIESASGATLTAAVDKYYTMTNVGTLDITLPTMTDATKVKTIVFYISTDSAPAVTFTSTHTVLYSDGFQIDADSTYEINALWNGTAWVVAMVKIIIPSS